MFGQSLMHDDRLNVYGLTAPGNFGIDYKLPIWTDSIQDIDFTYLKEYAKNNIIDKKLNKLDFNSDSTDQYWNKYNIFSVKHETINGIKKKIIGSYNDFLIAYKKEPEKELWINGWLNILTKGESLKIHNHSMNSNSYLSGNIVLTDCKTTTNFLPPLLEHMPEYGVLKIPNFVGSLTMFPQWVHHYVDAVEEDIRITLGFDLHTRGAMDYYNNNQTIDSSATPIKLSVKLF